MTKVASTAVKVGTENDAADLLSQLGIEKSAIKLNRSVNFDTKLAKFCDGDFTTPKIFKDDNFGTYLRNIKASIGVVDTPSKKQLLNNIINGDIDNEVEMKVKSFENSDLPLSQEQSDALKAAKSAYKVYLQGIVAAAKRMHKLI